MTILSAIKTFIATYPSLDSGAPLTSDSVGASPVWYGVYPVSGNPVVETYIDGRKRKQFPFAFQSVEYTADELERLDNISFFEGFSEWLESQSNAGTLPTLGSGKTPELIEITSWAYLYQQGASDTGIYQILGRLVYEQDVL